MVFNHRLIWMFTLIAIYILVTPFAFTQNAGYFLDTSLNPPRFFQHLSWSDEEFALFYEVVIQRDDGEYRDYLHKSTEETFLYVSLPPGKYRFNVLPYDLLGQIGQISEWRAFEILTAYQPSIEKFYPSAFYMDYYSQRALDIAGSNLFDETEIYLRNNENSLFPIDRNILGTNRVTLFFDDENIMPGTYEIYFLNPGGLETSAGNFFIGYRRPVEFSIKLSWAPVIPIYGEMFETFDSKLYFAGAEFNFAAVTSRRSFLNYGLELSVAANALNSVFAFESDFNNFLNSNIATTAAWLDINLNMLLRKYFLHKLMAVTLKSGAGVSFLNRYGELLLENNNLDYIFQWNLGLSYMLRLLDVFHIEIGLDFYQYDTAIPSGFIKPRMGIVWKF